VLSVGTKSVCWLGVPLMIGGKARGLITVQSYTPITCIRRATRSCSASSRCTSPTRWSAARPTSRCARPTPSWSSRVEHRTSELADTNRELRAQINVREQFEHKLKHEALHDALTGLPNRSQLLVTLRNALARFHADPTATPSRCCSWTWTASRW
jgi:hypothetical protein